MVAVGAFVEEGVEEIEDVAIVAIVLFLVGLVLFERFNPLGMISVTGHFLQYLNLVVGGLEVVRRALHDLDGHVVVILEVFGQPDSREVAPA